MTNCIISGNNVLDGPGGGLKCFHLSASITNCRIFDNWSSEGGSGAHCGSCSPCFVNCTITGNISPQGNGGVYSAGRGSAIITNCILWGDSPPEIIDENSGEHVRYSNIQGGWTGTGNINQDPLFVNPILTPQNVISRNFNGLRGLCKYKSRCNRFHD